MSIPFTQYLRPNGRQETSYITRSEEIEVQAKEIIARGYEFEAEILTTNQVSFTIADHVLGMDVAIKICNNDEKVFDAVDEMVGKFHTLIVERDLRAGTTWL